MGDPTWCYDKEGNATLHYLASGEGPPDGLSLTPPPGTHPHERELAAIAAAAAAAEVKAVKDAELEKEWRTRPMSELIENLEQPRRGPGRPRKTPWQAPDGT
jgi:hypothetical protein